MRLIALAALLIACLARGADANPLEALRDEIDTGAAQVLLVWTPAGSHALATGRLRPGGRETREGDRFLLASVTKPFVAAALMRLHAEGRLDIDAPAAPLLPPSVVAGLGGLEGVSVAHLLTMTSGLPDYLDDLFVADWAEGTRRWTPEAVLAYAEDEAPLFAPGRGFDYSNTNYVLAQLVLERVTGRSLEAALRALVLDPSGAARTEIIGMRARRAEDAAGLSRGRDVAPLYSSPGLGDGGLIAPAADVAAFLRALLVEHRLLPAAALARMLQDPLGAGYGMGLDVTPDAEFGRVYSHSGGDEGFSTLAVVLPDRPAVAVLLRGDEQIDEDLLWQALDLVP